MCGCDEIRKLKFTVYDLKSDGDLDKQYSLYTSVQELKNKVFKMLDFDNQLSKLKILSVTIDQVHNYIDYLTSGVQINLLISIDFTASNKP